MQSSKKRSRWSSDSSSDSEGGEEASASTAASLPMAVRSQAMLSSARPGEGESGSYTASHALGKTSSTIAEMLVSSVQADYTLAGQLLTSSCNASKSTVSNNTSYNSAIVGCRSVDNYERLNYISSGTYGDVFRARDISSGEIVALKQVKPNEQLESRQGFSISALREINILLALRHPNIVAVREMVVGSSVDKVFMVMEYLGSDLSYVMNKYNHAFSIGEMKRLMVQLVSAVEFMHDKFYIHRDLKTSNLLLGENGKLVVCDFGMARKYSSLGAAQGYRYTQEVVTLWYRAPELLLGETDYSTAIDVWSMGCIFGEIIGRKPLFPGEGESDQVSKIAKLLGAPSESNWPEFSKLPNATKFNWTAYPKSSKLRDRFPPRSFTGGPCIDDSGFSLLTSMLAWSPILRITAAAASKHPWFVSELPKATPLELMPTFLSRHEKEEHDA